MFDFHPNKDCFKLWYQDRKQFKKLAEKYKEENPEEVDEFRKASVRDYYHTTKEHQRPRKNLRQLEYVKENKEIIKEKDKKRREEGGDILLYKERIDKKLTRFKKSISEHEFHNSTCTHVLLELMYKLSKTKRERKTARYFKDIIKLQEGLIELLESKAYTLNQLDLEINNLITYYKEHIYPRTAKRFKEICELLFNSKKYCYNKEEYNF